MKNKFDHKALHLNQEIKVIFIAMSKKLFYFRRHAVKFVLEKGHAPISPFGIFDYFLIDSINRDLVRRANNNLIRISDELWVFGPISDGVLAEIKIVKEMKKPIKYFQVINGKEIKAISKEGVEFEEELEGASKDEL